MQGLLLACPQGSGALIESRVLSGYQDVADVNNPEPCCYPHRPMRVHKGVREKQVKSDRALFVSVSKLT